MKQNSNFANFLLFFRDKFMEKMADFLGILLKNLGPILPEYEKKAHFAEIFWGKEERNWFWVVFTNVFNETKQQFCQYFFLGVGGGNDEH